MGKVAQREAVTMRRMIWSSLCKRLWGKALCPACSRKLTLESTSRPDKLRVPASKSPLCSPVASRSSSHQKHRKLGQVGAGRET